MDRNSSRIRIGLDHYDHPIDAVSALAFARFLDGHEPWARSVHIARVRPDASLLPPGTVPSRHARSTKVRAILANGTDWTLQATWYTDGSASVLVTAASEPVLETVLAAATRDAAIPAPPPDEPVATIGFWYRTNCATRRERLIDVTTWDAI